MLLPMLSSAASLSLFRYKPCLCLPIFPPYCLLSPFFQILRSTQQWATMTSTPKINCQLRNTRSTAQQQNCGVLGSAIIQWRPSEQVCTRDQVGELWMMLSQRC